MDVYLATVSNLVILICIISVQCKGNVLSAKTGIIQSPEYPNLYPPFADCEWNIAVERGYSIVLDFEDVCHLSLSVSCTLCHSIEAVFFFFACHFK